MALKRKGDSATLRCKFDGFVSLFARLHPSTSCLNRQRASRIMPKKTT